jgi:hypothetical protein
MEQIIEICPQNQWSCKREKLTSWNTQQVISLLPKSRHFLSRPNCSRSTKTLFKPSFPWW